MTLSARKINLCWCVELQDFAQIYVSEYSWWGSGSLFTWMKNLEMARCIDQNVCLNKITLRITTYTKHLQILNTMRLYVELKNRIWNKKRRSDNYLRRSSKASYLTQRLTSRSESNAACVLPHAAKVTNIQRQYFTRMANKDAVGKTTRFNIYCCDVPSVVEQRGHYFKKYYFWKNILAGIWSLFAIFFQN